MRTRLRRLGGALIPWAVAIFLVLVAGDEQPAQPGEFDAARAAAMLLAVVQGAALHWRRERPELVTAVVLAGGVGYQLIVPEVVHPDRGPLRDRLAGGGPAAAGVAHRPGRAARPDAR